MQEMQRAFNCSGLTNDMRYDVAHCLSSAGTSHCSLTALFIALCDSTALSSLCSVTLHHIRENGQGFASRYRTGS